MVLYLLMFESEVEPSKLDFTWLNGPEEFEREKKKNLLVSLANLSQFANCEKILDITFSLDLSKINGTDEFKSPDEKY